MCWRRATEIARSAGPASRSGRPGLDAHPREIPNPLHLGFFLISVCPMNTLFKALTHPVRRRIIEMLRKGPLASGDIAAAFDMSWPSITAHLNALKEAGLVSPERDGGSIRYRREISVVEEAIAFLLDMTGAAARDDTQGKEPKP